jgi:hypothetical protein
MTVSITCPVCGKHATKTARHYSLASTCPNGHRWHYVTSKTRANELEVVIDKGGDNGEE